MQSKGIKCYKMPSKSMKKMQFSHSVSAIAVGEPPQHPLPQSLVNAHQHRDFDTAVDIQ